MDNLPIEIQNFNSKKAFIYKGNLWYKKKGIFQKIRLADIIYLQANDDYTICYTKTERFKFSSNLRIGYLEKLLAKHVFFRCHRSYLVNLRKATAVDVTRSKIIIQGHQIPFSRRMKRALIGQAIALQININ